MPFSFELGRLGTVLSLLTPVQLRYFESQDPFQ